MDLESLPKKPYPRFVGVLLALFIPGIAHYLSGAKKTGLILLALAYGIPLAGICLAATPHLFSIYLGLTLLVLSLLFILGILVKSFRPIPRFTGKGWARLVGTIIAINIFEMLLEGMMPIVPYKVPTSAMEPTLHGIHASQGAEVPSFTAPFFQGKSYEEYRAEESGPVSNIRTQNNQLIFTIGETLHHLPGYVMPNFRPKPHYTANEIIWSGTVQLGDHLLANRFSYIFSQPRRGDIITFSTDGINHPAVRPTIYTKRIVGLPGETVGIRDGQLIVNGEPVRTPSVFQTLEYGNAGQLSDEEQSITLGDDEFLVFGDNTRRNMSLDGRFFGPIKRYSIIAKVQTVYWPFNRIRVVGKRE